MKLSNSYFFTFRENQKDEDSTSSNLLVRSGMVKKAGSGIYYFLPLGYRVLKKIEGIIRDEMNKTGAQELLMPSLLPEDVYVASGRKEAFGNDMFSLKDRYQRNYVLGPTHEEMFVYAAKDYIHSYKDMPVCLYQIANKYRDEPRPRYGLIRVREFIMKDAYSFDKDDISLEESYQKMYKAYQNTFDRVGLDYRIVKASTGAMGGILSEEFQALSDIGEDTIVLCDSCSYSSNLEISDSKMVVSSVDEKEDDYQLFHTPGVGKIKDLVDLGLDVSRLVKTLIYRADDKFVACLVRGNREVSEDKVKKFLSVKELTLATSEEVLSLTSASIGYVGPIGLDIAVLVDEEVLSMKNFLVGANKTDYHYIQVNLKDFNYIEAGNIRLTQEGDICPVCGGKLTFKKSIEVGNTFKLGTKYSESLGLFYKDENNQDKPVVMGCYGIGLGRVLASLVEQKHDDNGIIFPMEVAPFTVSIVLINPNNQEMSNIALSLYQKLQEVGIDVVLDDRDERPGVKFKDMDLIGVPIRITVGKKVNDGLVELKLRTEDVSSDCRIEDIYSEVLKLVNHM
ncbi:MAG: proline--tRNA ligase [Firmicutes bacterium]|nr:proline--tRNA ligase [Bacillota bacterium]